MTNTIGRRTPLMISTKIQWFQIFISLFGPGPRWFQVNQHKRPSKTKPYFVWWLFLFQNCSLLHLDSLEHSNIACFRHKPDGHQHHKIPTMGLFPACYPFLLIVWMYPSGFIIQLSLEYSHRDYLWYALVKHKRCQVSTTKTLPGGIHVFGIFPWKGITQAFFYARFLHMIGKNA